MSGRAERHDVRAWTGASPALTGTLADLVDLMGSAWAEPDHGTRVEILEQCLAPEVSYASPLAQLDGVPAVAAMIGAVQARYPGHRLVRTSGIDLHHAHARYDWAMQDHAGAGAALTGTTVVALDPAPRIRQVVSFFGPTPRITLTYTYGATAPS